MGFCCWNFSQHSFLSCFQFHHNYCWELLNIFCVTTEQVCLVIREVWWSWSLQLLWSFFCLCSESYFSLLALLCMIEILNLHFNRNWNWKSSCQIFGLRWKCPKILKWVNNRFLFIATYDMSIFLPPPHCIISFSSLLTYDIRQFTKYPYSEPRSKSYKYKTTKYLVLCSNTPTNVCISRTLNSHRTIRYAFIPFLWW